MEILVCVKRVPDTADAEIGIRPDKKGIVDEDLAFGIGEWDNYAVEEAIRLKEAHGGTVTVVTVGSEESEEVLRRCLAMGADDAIRVDTASVESPDPFAVARALEEVARKKAYDLVLTGALSGDDGYGIVGAVLAGRLGRPHATLVTSVDAEGTKVVVTRELEGGLEEILAIELPAVLTIQTGINEPRYVSIMGIRKVRAKEIPVLTPAGEAASLLGPAGLSVPPAGKEAVFLTGAPAEVAQKILDLVKERGGVA
jgi:electron transfer flavoprotein beta subunit